MFRNILVPTDGSALAGRAVKKAIAMARESGAKITVFHVAPPYRSIVYSDYIPPDFVTPAAFEKRTRETAGKLLESVRRQAAAAGVKATTAWVASDFAADAIVKAAKKHKCDLIAMASHGRSGLSKLLLGSETQKVLAATKVPVLVLH